MLPLQIILLLSCVQGFAEFLPISSAAHLLLVERWLNLPENSLTFDIALNLGTLLTIVVYFRKYIYLMLVELKQVLTLKVTNYSDLLIAKLFLGSVPVVIVGFVLMHFKLEQELRSSILILSISLIIFGIILYLVDVFSKSTVEFNKINIKQAFFIGTMQCLALIPGVSRSGSTITAARWQKVNREDAVRFSFLLAIPSTLGAVVLSFFHALKHGTTFYYQDMLLGVVLSFIFGLIFISILLKFIAKYNFLVFAIYRVLVGLLLIWLFT